MSASFFDPLFTDLFQSSNSLPGSMALEEGFFWDINIMAVISVGMTRCHFFSISPLPFGFFKTFQWVCIAFTAEKMCNKILFFLRPRFYYFLLTMGRNPEMPPYPGQHCFWSRQSTPTLTKVNKKYRKGTIQNTKLIRIPWLKCIAIFFAS